LMAVLALEYKRRGRSGKWQLPQSMYSVEMITIGREVL
jgi:hypothetical protein